MGKGRGQIYQQVKRERWNKDTNRMEVVEVENSYRTKVNEQFTMMRFTVDDKWVLHLRGVLPLLLVMSQWIDSVTSTIALSSERRNYLVLYFGMSNKRSLTTLLSSAISLNGLVRVNGSTSCFMINPSYIYRGSTKEHAKKVIQYEGYRNELSRMIANTNFENE